MKVAAHELVAARPGEGVEDLRLDAFGLDLTYALKLPDGAARRFGLHIRTRGEGQVSVRETDEARQLPAACPERHINGDGSFCLGLSEDEPDITTAAGVDAWWRRLAGFLRLQVLADESRRWPEEQSWRHGDAALSQRALEKLLRDTPWLTNRPISFMWNGLLAGRRAPCPCGSGIEARRCHEDLMIRVGRLRQRMAAQEAEYYRNWSAPCCGTMAECGVQNGLKTRRLG